jgi:rhodanese-related sulfurtransferase
VSTDIIAGRESEESAMPASTARRICEAVSRLREVAPLPFHARVRPGVLIDVREPTDLANGGGVIAIPRGVPLPGRRPPGRGQCRLAALPGQQRPQASCCRIGGRGALATAGLQAVGSSGACSIAGDAPGWTAAGLPATMR